MYLRISVLFLLGVAIGLPAGLTPELLQLLQAQQGSLGLPSMRPAIPSGFVLPASQPLQSMLQPQPAVAAPATTNIQLPDWMTPASRSLQSMLQPQAAAPPGLPDWMTPELIQVQQIPMDALLSGISTATGPGPLTGANPVQRSLMQPAVAAQGPPPQTAADLATARSFFPPSLGIAEHNSFSIGLPGGNQFGPSISSLLGGGTNPNLPAGPGAISPSQLASLLGGGASPNLSAGSGAISPSQLSSLLGGSAVKPTDFLSANIGQNSIFNGLSQSDLASLLGGGANLSSGGFGAGR